MAGWTAGLILLGFAVVVSAYELGAVHKYAYETTVLVGETCDAEADPVGHQIKSKVQLTAVWTNPQIPLQKVIKIQISDLQLLLPKKSKFVDSSSRLPKSQSGPSYALLEDGWVRRIWDGSEEDHYTRNVKRALASLLQFRRTSGRFREADVSGDCDATYESTGNSVLKQKSNCFVHGFDKTLSMLPGIRSSDVERTSTHAYDLTDDGGVISKCSSLDTVRVHSNAWRKPSLCVHSRSQLLHEGTSKDDKIFADIDLQTLIENLRKSHPGKLEENSLEAIIVKQELKSSKLSEAVAKQAEALKASRLASLKSASAFYKLLPLFRAASKEEILVVLGNPKLKAIKPQLLDLAAASLTKSSLQAAFEFFSSSTDYDELLERFLVSLSVTPRQQLYVLREIKSFTEKVPRHEKVHATLVTTLGASLKNYADNDFISEKEAVDEYRLYLEKNLEKCKLDSCRLPYLRGLRNAGRPESATVLLKYVAKGGKVALEAINALKNIPSHQLTKEAVAELRRVLLQIGEKQDRSSRVVAAEILLKSSPTSDLLRTALCLLSDQRDPEFATHLAARLMRAAGEDDQLRSKISKILMEKEIGHYYSLAQKGVSFLSKNPLMDAKGLNVSYSIEMEMLDGGHLKRCLFDVDFKSGSRLSNFLTVGILAEGLASLVGGAEDEWEESSGPTAGIELTLMGSQLRPYVLFSSTSELMGHAWSGTASEPTPVLQGIFSFSDDERVEVLSNGMPVRVQLRGALSVDASGSIQVSLWNRNSQSLVRNAGALLMRASAAVEGPATTQGAAQFAGQASIDFRTDTEFAQSPFRMCLTMEHPSTTVKYDLHRSVSIGQYRLRRSKRRKRHLEGRSFPLHKRNSEMCQAMDS